jgi:drug/metabolite transporter (DMT)-like permease
LPPGRLAGLGATPDFHHGLLAPIAAILGGTLAWAAGSLYARPPRVPRSLALSAGMSLTAGGVLLLAVSWSVRELTGFSLREVSSTSLAALAYLVVFGSLVGFSAYSWLLRVAPPSRVATHAYVNPLVAIALGSALAGEPLTSTIVCAGLAIAGGVALAVRGGSPPSPRMQADFQHGLPALAGQSGRLPHGAHADA